MQHITLLTIRILHVLILVFVVFGWLLTSRLYLTLHLLFVPLVILQWKLNKGRCILTDLEHRILGNSSRIEGEEESPGFVKRLIMMFTKTDPTDAQVDMLMYVIMAISFVLSLFKIM